MATVTDPAFWLTLDRGNTTLDAALAVRAGRTSRRARLEPSAQAILEFVGDATVARAVGVDVRAEPSRWDAAEEACGRLGVSLQRAGVELRCPLALAYGRPETLGTDRWVAAVAAHAGWGDAVIVDCGTAVTVDAVTRDGRFVGGAIAPGLRAMADGLAAKAPRLPLLAADASAPEAWSMPTGSSAAAVEAGLRHGFAGSVHALVDRLLAAWGQPGREPVVLLTGGDAGAVEALVRRCFVVVPDLLHRGLRELAAQSPDLGPRTDVDA